MYKNRQDNDILIWEDRVFSKHVITNMFNLESSHAKSHPNKYTNKIIINLLYYVVLLFVEIGIENLPDYIISIHEYQNKYYRLSKTYLKFWR